MGPFKETVRESKGGEKENREIKCHGSHGSIVISWRGLNLGNRPGKSTGVHKFTAALLGHGAHTLSLTHTQNCDKLQ